MASGNAGAVTLSDADVFGATPQQHMSDADVFGTPEAPQVGVAEDVAKAIPSGLAKGGIGLVSLPGDLVTLVGSVARRALEHVMPSQTTPEERAKIENDFWDKMTKQGAGVDVAMPMTSSDIQKGVEQVTGPFHEAKTTPGKYAETISEMVPAAVVAGPEGAVSNVAKFAAAPGVASEAAGEYTQGSPFEGAARFVAGLAGGLGGIGAGRGIEAAKNYAAARDAASQLGPDINPGAVSRMAKSFEADNLTPQIVAAKQAALGPEAMALDMGRQMQGRAEAIAAQPGSGQNTVLDAVEGRVHGTDQFGNVQSQFGAATADRIKQTLDAQLGVSHNKVDLLNGVSDIVDRHAKPLYQQVMADHPVVDVPSDITSRPAVASAMKNATTLAKQYGEDISQPARVVGVDESGELPTVGTQQIPAQTSLRYWDYVKKDLDRRINSYMKSGGASELNSADKADLGGLIDARRALVDHLDNVTNGDYAEARRVWSFKPQLTEAYETGRGAFNNSLLPEEFADQVNNMSAPEQVMAKAGYRRELDRVIDVARNDGAAARRMLDTNANLQKTEALFGPQARQSIEDRIAGETAFQDAANKIAANSRTGVRSQLVKDTESPSEASPPQANLTGFLYKGAGKGLSYLRNQGMENTRAGIGQMATMGGPQLRTLAQVLADLNARKAANIGTPMARQGSGLLRVLLANPATGVSQPLDQPQP